MKKILATIGLILSIIQVIFAGDLFFSEYIEGSGNNKAIEIYNPTGAAVDLSQYTIKQANNGSGWGRVTISGVTSNDTRYVLPLSGTLNAGDVYVIYNAGNSQYPVSDAIKDEGDLGLAYNETANGGDGDNVPSFNGDDALGLFKGDVLIDVIGVPTTDPGNGWSVAGTSNATVDHTLVRKPTITQGNTDWDSSAGTSADNSEWIIHPKDTFSFIGFHGSINVAPLAVAGIDRIEHFNTTVTLDGSNSSDPDGSITSYIWNQVSGTSVSLSATNQAIVTFTSPSTVTELKFELAVTDDSSAVSKDTVKIYVDQVPVIISEYVEGSSYNKYLEIYNASNGIIDLAAEGFDLRKTTDGNGIFGNTFNEWGSFSQLPSGGIIVLGNNQATLYSNVNITNNEVINFNGNDAVGLFRNGLLVDIVGEPYNVENIIQDQTLRRKNTVIYGSSTYISDEWEQYAKDDVAGLGWHSINPNAPVISDLVISPDFATSADEISVSATLTAVVGSIASAKIHYGAAGSLVNETAMWQESGNLWMGAIPAQTGNSTLEFYISCSDNATPANTGQSANQSLIIANSTPLPISDIHTNITTLDGQMVTIQGVVTVGANLLRNDRTSAYIQDITQRGLNLYDETMYADITRGDELMVVGYVELYGSTVEITNFKYKKINTGLELPEPAEVTVAQANSSDWEGTLISMIGTIADFWISGGGQSVKVKSGDDSILVRIWNTTGIDTTAYLRDQTYRFIGIGSKYTPTSGTPYYQVLVAYLEDIIPYENQVQPEITRPLQFALNPVYPNPFNPSTKISWQLDQNGNYELTIFNILGQKIEVIRSGYAYAGSYSMTWNASKFPSGIYFLQLQAGNRVKTQKMLYLK